MKGLYMMSDASSDPNDGAGKRNPPSWMSSKGKESKPLKKKQDDAGEHTSSHAGGRDSAQANSQFAKLLDGVVFALSGFVNPERSTLRSQALEMGAEYRPDWTPDCTLLVCSFPNTPKFRQVASDCGTIVSKEWISECYNEKKLVEIERFLMHAGKPWRRNNDQLENKKGPKDALNEESGRRPRRNSPEKFTGSAKSKVGLSNVTKDHFSPSKIKEWAIDDLNKTVTWLESQEEKPEASEIKAIAAQGVITCLHDVIEALKEKKDIQLVMEQWMFIPHVVKQLLELETGRSKKGSLSKGELRELAITCKKIYESEFENVDSSLRRNGKQKAGIDDEDDAGFDSDRTIEMTEEEIEIACKELSS
ncbi:DNA-repair protein XRCC1 [Asparagus officinalis]|nr:DNA-repair protein XRCC1 [Asparagus officinalis]XP_020268933.1 DNA-repair protein XRCC1 [Asparagus officinalis]